MNATDLTFGVEFEVTVPIGTITRIGGYHHGLPIPGLPQGWNAQHDCSIRASGGMQGVEVVSPILQGEAGLRQLQEVCRWFASIGAKVNRSCGFHVHVGFAGQDRKTLERLVNAVACHEKALFAATGTHSREANQFCRSVQADTRFQQHELERTDRYHVLNVNNLMAGRQTVEFRVFAGTTNAEKAISYATVCLGLVEKAIKSHKPSCWVAKVPAEKSPVRRGGEGLTALNRLFYYLGWTKGRTDYTFGQLAGEGLPSIADLKTELVRLARKYDAADESEIAPVPEAVVLPVTAAQMGRRNGRPFPTWWHSRNPDATPANHEHERRLRRGAPVTVIHRGQRIASYVRRRWPTCLEIVGVDSVVNQRIRVPLCNNLRRDERNRVVIEA